MLRSPHSPRHPSRSSVRGLAAALTLLVLVAAGSGLGAQEVAVLVGAGDIASCLGSGDEETARLLDLTPGTVFTAGDNAYERGTPQEFAECFGPSWGRHLNRMRPAPGNHDYLTPGARGYFTYFGASAGDPDKGYYGYDLGRWHVIVLNSNCRAVGGCGPDSPQGRWLRAELSRDPRLCTLAYWHHPRFSSGLHGSDETVAAFWEMLYAAGAELVVSGHDHLYERFLPQTPSAVRNDERGIQQFTVGTGGRSLYRFRDIKPHSAVRRNSSFGVLKLTLAPTRYSWEFIETAGRVSRDAGTRACH